MLLTKILDKGQINSQGNLLIENIPLEFFLKEKHRFSSLTLMTHEMQ